MSGPVIWCVAVLATILARMADDAELLPWSLVATVFFLGPAKVARDWLRAAGLRSRMRALARTHGLPWREPWIEGSSLCWRRGDSVVAAVSFDDGRDDALLAVLKEAPWGDEGVENDNVA